MTETRSALLLLLMVFVLGASPCRRGPVSYEDAQPNPETNPLADLAYIAPLMNQGLDSLLVGEEPVKAFDPFVMRPVAQERLRRLKLDLVDANMAHAMFYFYEFELLFKGEKNFLLRTGVQPSPEGGEFAYIEFEPEAVAVRRSLPLALYDDSMQPFSKAASNLVRWLTGPQCAELPIVSDRAIRLFAPPGSFERLLTQARETRESFPQLCEILRTLEYDDVRLRLDDAGFMVVDFSGQPAGFLRTSFDAQPALGLMIGFPQLKEF